MDKDVFYQVDGKEYCNHLSALVTLMADGVVRPCPGSYLDGTQQCATTLLYVLCSDLFSPCCADGEDLPYEEIGRLYRLHRENESWGWAKWCCLQRQLRPMPEIVTKMKADGAWDATLESLPPDEDEEID